MKEEEKQQKQKGNVYDRIFKENAAAIFIPLVERQLNIKIKHYEALSETLTKTIEREMDSFYSVETEEGEKFLLHIEFQTKNDKEMIYRMSEYHGLIFREYKMPIKHIVVYLGKSRATMRTRLLGDELFWGFDLISINELNPHRLLSSQVPEVILLSLLSDHDKKQTEAILRLIISRLKKVCDSKKELAKFIYQLTVLSRLRKIENLTSKIIQEMYIEYDVKQDGLYQRGHEEGHEEGEVKGLKKGIDIGVEKGIDIGVEKGIDIGVEKERLAVVIACLEEGDSYEKIARITKLDIKVIAKIDEERKEKKENQNI